MRAPSPGRRRALQAILSSAGWAAGAALAQSPPTPAPVPDAASAPSAHGGFGLPERDYAGLLAERARTEWLVRQLKGDPAVVVIQFPTLQAQGLTLNRVAALVEKSGADRTHVLSDADLDALIHAQGDTSATFYLGHDYAAPDLARFFTAAARQGVELNAQEQGLLSLLRQIGFLVADEPGGFRAAANAALVTFGAPQAGDEQVPADQAMDAARRASVLGHELSHGIYFTRAAYRELCHRYWNEQLTSQERELWRRYLRGLGYDGRNEDLLVNEMQALLMHTSDPRDFDAAVLGVSDAQLEGMRNRFIMNAASGPGKALR